MPDGFIYVMSNPSFADSQIKIEKSSKDPSIRKNERIKSNEPKPESSEERIARSWLGKPFRREYESFLNVVSHNLDLLTFLIDQIPDIDFLDYRPIAISHAFLSYQDFLATLEWGLFISDSNGMKETIEIRFENGEPNIQIAPGFLRNQASEVTLRIDQKGKAAGIKETKIKSDYVWSFEQSDRAFVDAIKTGKQSDHSGNNCVQNF